MAKIQGNPLSTVLAPETGFAIGKFMQEHADYERKSLEYVLGIIGKYPEKTYAVEALGQIALGTVTIFTDICSIMLKREIPLMPESPQNLYLKQIAWLGRSVREERFLDRLLLGSIVESRCATRFEYISTLVDDAELITFYKRCSIHKQQYSEAYMRLAQETGSKETVLERFLQLTLEEEKVMASQKGVTGIF